MTLSRHASFTHGACHHLLPEDVEQLGSGLLAHSQLCVPDARCHALQRFLRHILQAQPVHVNIKSLNVACLRTAWDHAIGWEFATQRFKRQCHSPLY